MALKVLLIYPNLRGMNMLFEGLKEKGSMIIVPSSALDTMNLGAIGGLVILIGLLLGIRVIYHYLTTGLVSPFLPTAILSAMTMIVGFQILVFAFMADMMGQQRRLQEEVLYRIKSKAFE